MRMGVRSSRRRQLAFRAIGIGLCASAGILLSAGSRPIAADPACAQPARAVQTESDVGLRGQASPRADETRRVETVAPGLEHVVIRRGDFAKDVQTDRWTINVLVLDPAKVRMELGRAMDEGVGTEPVSSMARRHGAVAAVNGGYFRTAGLYKGEPAGVVVIAGKVKSEPAKRRPGLAVADVDGSTRAAVVRVDFRAEVKSANGKTFPVNGVDRPRDNNELILFTPDFHKTTLTGPRGVEAVVADGAVVSVSDGRGSFAIPANGCVLSATGKARQWVLANLHAGEPIEIRQTAALDPAPSFSPDFIIGGGPLLVREGKAAVDNDPGAYDRRGFLEKRHPRTAAGLRADGRIVLVTVDGRQPSMSVGMTIPELEALMIELGAAEAINLDGGGSTTMVVKNKVVNSPSDIGGERAVSDALLVFLR